MFVGVGRVRLHPRYARPLPVHVRAHASVRALWHDYPWVTIVMMVGTNNSSWWALVHGKCTAGVVQAGGRSLDVDCAPGLEMNADVATR